MFICKFLDFWREISIFKIGELFELLAITNDFKTAF
jgi:hypothetical protein